LLRTFSTSQQLLRTFGTAQQLSVGKRCFAADF